MKKMKVVNWCIILGLLAYLCFGIVTATELMMEPTNWKKVLGWLSIATICVIVSLLLMKYKSYIGSKTINSTKILK